MRSLLHKAKDARVHSNSRDNGHSAQVPLERTRASQKATTDPNNYAVPIAPTSNDIFRYRYQHGTNLGSTFVLEKWLTPSMFPSNATDQQTSELKAFKASVKAIGINATRAKWEQHWQSAISDGDLSWLVSNASCKPSALLEIYYALRKG